MCVYPRSSNVTPRQIPQGNSGTYKGKKRTQVDPSITQELGALTPPPRQKPKINFWLPQTLLIACCWPEPYLQHKMLIDRYSYIIHYIVKTWEPWEINNTMQFPRKKTTTVYDQCPRVLSGYSQLLSSLQQQQEVVMKLLQYYSTHNLNFIQLWFNTESLHFSWMQMVRCTAYKCLHCKFW